MSNRLYNQFSYSDERQAVNLMGKFTVTQVQTMAARTIDGITYTAKAFGSAGNSITIEIIDGGTAGSEVVTVVGSAITVEIEDTVSTRTQVKDAIDAFAPAAALVDVSVTSGATAASLTSALPLQNGLDTVFSSNAMPRMTLTQTAVGLFSLVLLDEFPNLLSAQVQLLSPSASVLVPQIVSEATAFGTAKTIVIRTCSMIDQSLVDMAVGQALFIHLILRNSSK